MSSLSLLSKAASLVAALALFSPFCVADEPDSEVAYWAPGIINREEGTVELDVTFFHDQKAMVTDWNFLFRLSGNAPDGGTSILAMVLCPSMDARGMLVLARGEDSSASTQDEIPDFAPQSTHRFVLSWGDGRMDFWLDGKLMGRQAFEGSLGLLPAEFFAGYDYSVGLPASYQIEAVRISDCTVPGSEVVKAEPLESDAHTTYLYREDGSVVTGKTAWQTEQFRAALFPYRAAQRFATDEGVPLVLPLRGVNFQSQPCLFQVHADVWDSDGEPVAQAETSVTVPAGAEYQPLEVALPVLDAPGYYRALLTFTTPWGTSESHEIRYIVQIAESLQPGKLAGYLGHHLMAFKDIGYQWVRTWADDRQFLWCYVEPEQGEFYWAAADKLVAEAKADDVHLVGVLGYPPAWASTYSPDEYKKIKRPNKTYSTSPHRFQPRSLEEWKVYIRAVVSRYHEDVKYWELYNEVDFHPPAMHATFSGTTEDYFELLKATHEIIQEIDPSCRLLISGFSLTPGVTDVQMPIDLLNMGAAPYFDIFNVHGYTNRETIEKTVRAAREAKPGVPLWMTEYMYEKPTDDYQVTTKAFWFLSQGFSKYFIIWGELDRNFDRLNITPFYAVSAELSRQLRVCDEYLGPVEGAGSTYSTWKLRRSDGSYLYVFAANNGTVRLRFSASGNSPEAIVTDLYGDVLQRGPFDLDQPFVFSSLVYLTTSADLEIVDSEREYGNALANGGFEIREGDYLAEESAARPSSWTLRPSETPPSAMSFTEGFSGEYSLLLKSSATSHPVIAGQVLTLDYPGLWSFSAEVKAPAGAKGFLTLKQNQGGVWNKVLTQSFTGTGEWETVCVEGDIQGQNTLAVALIGLETPESELQIDDVVLIK